MRLNPFRRRIAPADLPPVSTASMPGPLHSGLTGDLTTLTAAAALDGAAVLAEVVSQAAVKVTPEDEPAPIVATEWPSREPRRIEPPLGGLAPLGMTPPLWKPGRYTVTYDRVGDHGRRGSDLPPLPALTAICLTVGELAQQIVTDLHQLAGLTTTVMVDQAISGGVILGHGGVRLGTFTYERRDGGRHATTG
jgi:hypothetical protein